MSKKSKKDTKVNDLPSIFGTPETRGYLNSNPELTETMIDWLCSALLEFSNDPDSLYIETFRRRMNIPKRTYYNWLKKYPKLKDAHEEARSNIGYVRMEGATKNKFNLKAIMYNQYRFGKDWKEDDDYQDKRQQKIEGVKSGNIIIEMTEAEKTDIVPDKNKEKP